MRLRSRIVRALGDGRFHSGEALAQGLHVSRTAVWQIVQDLQRDGLDVQAVRGRGYRLARPVTWLDGATIQAALPADIASAIDGLEVLDEVDSTNTRLMEATPPAPGRAQVCLAEFQTAGRGRRGRTWIAPLGGSLCLSVAWLFDPQPPGLPTLGLGIGAAIATALGAHARVGMKWPNDLVAEGRKLGGILVEMEAEANGPAHVVVGVGVNVRLSRAAAVGVVASGGLAPVGLADLARRVPGRNALASELVTATVTALRRFAGGDAEAMLADWRTVDALFGQPVEVHHGSATIAGVARGIDRSGALVLETADGVQRLVSGDVTVRPE